MRITQALMGFGLVLLALVSAPMTPAGAMAAAQSSAARPQGPCDIYAAAGDPCVAAHSTTRALLAAYNGPLYQVLRQSDGKTLNIGVVRPSGSDRGGYADAAAQDAFCANTVCWISMIYDQSGKGNHLTQAPRGAFSGPAMGGANNLPIADMAPVTLNGHKVYGVFIMPGMGLRNNDTKGVAVDDQAEGQYWVINGQHFNSGCCFDYGNAEIDSRDDDNGTMETLYFGNATSWYYGNPPGPWVMTDQENNLVGCVNPGSTSKLCANLPNVTSRFVTGIAKGRPHFWSSMGGDSQKGPLSVMYAGQRVDGTYDPMRKQGAILLGNGGDNSVGSQGTFYEAAMTAAGTYPTDATDQAVQANIVAARYDVPSLTVSPANAVGAPVQTFALRSSQEVRVAFTNTTGAPVSALKLGLNLPKGWSADAARAIAGPLAPGAATDVTFKVKSGPAAFNGDLVATASWAGSGRRTETAVEKVRNASPVKINEFRLGDTANPTNAFIELYNAGDSAADLSGWSLVSRPTQLPAFSDVRIPAGTRLAPHGFYLMGLAASGLVTSAAPGDNTLFVRSVTGLSVGDTVTIGTGASAETRKITGVGAAASPATTLWQPQPDGQITVPAGSTNVPVTSAAGFVVGQKIAIGAGATYPSVARGPFETYEVATVTAVGKAGAQTYLGADAAPGDTRLQVTSVASITAGDKIRLDIDSMGHGVETVTVTSVGTAAVRTNLAAEARRGATSIRLRNAGALKVGDRLNVGTPANRQVVTITAITPPAPPAAGAGGGPPGGGGAAVEFTPALIADHIAGEHVVDPGTGLQLAAPLKFAHAANLPVAVRGTGITFAPATRLAHSSNEPVQALGTGITLDAPLTRAHPIDAAVQDAAAKSAGYQDMAAPNLLFGGPAPSSAAGSMVLRDAAGLVVDSLNYGLMVDPWAAQGYQGVSGAGQAGCRVIAPGPRGGARPPGSAPAFANNSAGRFPDGRDRNSNCADFLTQGATTLPEGASAGAVVLKVASVTNFAAGQTVTIGSGAEQESGVIARVGAPGATHLTAAAAAGAAELEVAGVAGFTARETITVGEGPGAETAVVSATRTGAGGIRIVLDRPLAGPHAAGAPVAGPGITLAAGLQKSHALNAPVASDPPTPGGPNKYAGS